MAKFEVYATIFVLAIVFTVCDIVVSSCALTIPSLLFSSTTAVLGFIGAYMGRTIAVEEKYTEALNFIRKNFGLANIILSVLDVLCCVLALLTGVFCLMLVFRCTIALRIAIYINKYKTVSYAVLSLVFLHTFKKIKVREKMETKNTKFQNILGTIIVVFGVVGLVFLLAPNFTGLDEDINKYIGAFTAIISAVSGTVLWRSHDDVLTDEEVKAKEQNAALKKARKEAKQEIKARQRNEINSIAEQRLNEEQQAQNNNANTTQV